MDEFVNNAQKVDLAPKILKNLLSKSEDLLESNHAHLDGVLQVLDPRVSSLGYLFVLKAKINDQKKNDQTYISQVINFLGSFNGEQVRAAPVQFSQVSKHFTEILYSVRQPIRGVLPLKRAIAAFPSKVTLLTPIHADFLQLCILSKCYEHAVSVISQNMTDIDPETTNINIKDILCYFYYAGIIFTSLKKYKQALDSFKQVFTAPATALSAIAVEAYKKYYLVYLLVNGNTPGFPRMTPTVVQRVIKNHCKIYVEFGTVFSNNNVNEIHNKAAMNAEAFQKDKNFGLVKLAIQSIHRRNIKKLTQTFMTLSIKDIADNVKLTPPQAEAIVLKMIEDGEIFASINQKDGMVSFHENPESFSGSKILTELDTQINNVFQLDKKLRSMDEQFSTSNSYLKRLLSNEKRSAAQFEQGMIDDL